MRIPITSRLSKYRKCCVVAKLVLIWTSLTSLAIQGCSRTIGDTPAISSSKATLPVLPASSTDFGYVRSSSGPVSRIVQIRNSSNAIVHISRWVVSCDCLTVLPASIDVGPKKSTYVELVYDASKEGNEFVGTLRMSVEGLSGADCVCTFEVPVSVVAPEDVTHLNGMR